MSQEKISEKEIAYLANICEYVELICSERMTELNEKHEYRYDKKIISILEKTNCFIGLTPSELYSHVGRPTKSTDLLVSYYFRTANTSQNFTILNFGLENGVIVGQSLTTGVIEK